MSEKTIEVVSIHKGNINVTLKNDERRTIFFEDKGTVGYAKVDHDEAEILLGIGRPHYWKPGSETAEPKQPQVPSAPAAPDVLSLETYGNIPNVKALQDLLAATTDVPLVMGLIAIESQKETPRKSWMTALDERHKALTTPDTPGGGETGGAAPQGEGGQDAANPGETPE